MLAPHRFSVLACALLAVATPFVSHALPSADGAIGFVLRWPARLLALLPPFADALKTSALHLVLLYFAGYLLAWFVASNLALALLGHGRSRSRQSSLPSSEDVR